MAAKKLEGEPKYDREWYREYIQRPDVKEHRRQYAREYYYRPEAQKRMQEYNKRPDVRRRRVERNSEWRKNNLEKVTAQRREWKRLNPDKAVARNRRTSLKRYGITVEQYDQMLLDQKGVCALCGHPPKTKRLNVDHDHTTGRIRGLLCHQCNIMLGRIETRTSLDTIALYLRRTM